MNTNERKGETMKTRFDKLVSGGYVTTIDGSLIVVSKVPGGWFAETRWRDSYGMIRGFGSREDARYGYGHAKTRRQAVQSCLIELGRYDAAAEL